MLLPMNKPEIEVGHADRNHDLITQLLLSGEALDLIGNYYSLLKVNRDLLFPIKHPY